MVAEIWASVISPFVDQWVALRVRVRLRVEVRVCVMVRVSVQP